MAMAMSILYGTLCELVNLQLCSSFLIIFNILNWFVRLDSDKFSNGIGSDTLNKDDQFQGGQQAPECLSSFANIQKFAFQISPPIKLNSSMDGNLSWIDILPFCCLGTLSEWVFKCYIAEGQRFGKSPTWMSFVQVFSVQLCLEPVTESVFWDCERNHFSACLNVLTQILLIH